MFLDRKRKTFFINIFTALFLFIFLLPQEAGATPSGCSEGPAVDSCCGTARDPVGETGHPGWTCQDTRERERGSDGCYEGLCSGGATNMCCPPASGEGGAGSGSSVRESLKTAAREAEIAQGSISGTIKRVISTVLGFVGVIFLVLIIIGGLMWMTAGGNEERVGKSKKLITNAVIGTIIIMLAYILVSFVMGKIAG